MEIIERFVLASGAGLTAVSDLPEEIRRRFHHDEDDVALTSPRHPSQILSAQAASLLEGFRSPSRIVDAVREYAAANALDPEETLRESDSLLRSLIDDGFLIRESAHASGAAHSLQSGDIIGGYRIVDRIRVLDHSIIFQVRRDDQTFALELQRDENATRSSVFARQAVILRHLDGGIAPRLIADEIQGRPALLLEWCEGIDAETYANELRDEGRRGVLSLCREIAAVYARLHEAGVVHGNVHPRNLVVARDGRVRLTDFSRSYRPAIDAELPARAGVALYFDPDQARALAAGHTPPPASFHTDQHSVAAVLYLLTTGFDDLDFSCDKSAMLRQIVEEPPLPFAARALEPWPELEAILARCLSKDASSRFASMRAVSDALESIAAPDACRIRRSLPDLAGTVLHELSSGGDPFVNGSAIGPRSSVAYGTPGVAYALYRFARARADARLLDLARMWIDRTSMVEQAFVDESMGLTRHVVSAVSPYYAQSGVALMRAFIGAASDDDDLIRRAANEFLKTAFVDDSNLDLMTGRCGALLGAAMLLNLISPSTESHLRIREAGQSLMNSIVGELDPQPPIPDITPPANLGIAHGWGGNLYAIMRWCRSSAIALPTMVAVRLHELRELATEAGRGRSWKWQGRGRMNTSPVGGWCQGSAGLVHLWALAHELLGDDRFAEFAEAAGWSAWEADGADGQLCCGVAGRAYALLELHFHTGDQRWLNRAKRLTEKAILGVSRSSEPRWSLYRGILGIALLQSEMERGERVSMPMFGDETRR